MELLEQAQAIKDGVLEPFKVNAKVDLMQHELVCASFAFLMKKVLILDEMGVGKTVSSLGGLKLLSEEKPQKVLLLVPTSIIEQWRKEIEKFLGWTVVVIEGSSAKRLSKYLYFSELTSNAVLITNYSTPLHDLDLINSISFTSLVLDEATFVKNSETKAYSFVFNIGKKVENIFVLTGTPITLSLGDFYWLFSLLHIDGVVGSYEDEVVPYLEYKKKNGREQEVGASGFEPFLLKIEPYCIRRTLVGVFGDSDDMFAQFVNTKPKLEVYPLKYSNEQADLFQSLKQDANRASREGTYEPLKTYQKFLQACSSTKMILEGYQPVSPKEQFLLDFINSSDKRVVIYVRYLEYLKCLQSTLDSVKIGYNTISGQIDASERELQKKEFLETENRVLFITGAGKYGLNLQIASELIFMDIPYNPADLLQIMNRIYRYGQMEQVHISLLFLENTIEEDIFRKLHKRQKVLDEYFETNLAEIFERESKDFVWGFLEKNYPRLY